MNCTQAQDKLPGLLYGDLRSEEKSALEKHLAHCLACRREYAALGEVRKLLDQVAAPECQLEVAGLYRRAAARQVRRVDFWRRVAICCCGAAAALLMMALAWRMEVRLEPQQLIFRWGSPPAGGPKASVPPENLAQAPKVISPETEEQLRLQSRLIHALADAAESRDLRQQQELIALRDQIADLMRRTAQWRRDTERDVDALYTAQLVSEKGEKQ